MDGLKDTIGEGYHYLIYYLSITWLIINILALAFTIRWSWYSSIILGLGFIYLSKVKVVKV